MATTFNRLLPLALALLFCGAAWTSGEMQPAAAAGDAQPDLEQAQFACPMETHPDEADAARQGAYLSLAAGSCPWCGMRLKPVAEVAWVAARKAAGGGDVAYTCPEHPHVFAQSAAACPRCDSSLQAFKVMYTCPDARHAGVIRDSPAKCPHDDRPLTPFRGIWLGPEMADRNVPPRPEVAERAAYRCAMHPVVHSSGPGRCTVCAGELVPRDVAASAATAAPAHRVIPADVAYVCPMAECWYFSGEPGDCPVCGMTIKPVEDVAWVAAHRERSDAAPSGSYVCPMHAEDVSLTAPGSCPICGMQLVKDTAIAQTHSAPAAVTVQVNYLMEHYLALQERLSTDRADGVAMHALGLVGASDELIVLLEKEDDSEGTLAAVRALRAAALQLRGQSLDDTRVTFVRVGEAMRKLVDQVRPSRKVFPDIYIFHCPMTKGDWLQANDEIANPFYGFKMLSCGELQETK